MRIAVLSDIHGNLPALLAALETLEHHQYDTIINLGDQVGYGPFPNEVIDLLRERGVSTVLGNHDAGAFSWEPLRASWVLNEMLEGYSKIGIDDRTARRLLAL